MKLISVIIPTYNRAALIKRAVTSVLRQTYQHFEIIVVDDASVDATAEIVMAIGDPRVKYYRNSNNLGGSASRNQGIRLASGDYIAFLDSDDEWSIDKLDSQLTLFSQLGDTFGVVYCGYNILNDNGFLVKTIKPKYRGWLTKHLLVENVVGSFSFVLIKSIFIRQVGGLDESFPSVQDKEFYIRLSKICQFDFIERPLVSYHMAYYDPNRISNKINSVVVGRLKLFDKYKEDYASLNSKELSVVHADTGKHFFAAGAFKEGIKQILQALQYGRCRNFMLVMFIALHGIYFLLRRRMSFYNKFNLPSAKATSVGC